MGSVSSNVPRPDNSINAAKKGASSITEHEESESGEEDEGSDTEDNANHSPTSNLDETFDTAQSKFIEEAMATHNSCRARHGVPDLVHNPELSKIAQSYAEYLANRRTLIHSTNTYNGQRLGENLAFAFDSRLDFYSGKAQ